MFALGVFVFFFARFLGWFLGFEFLQVFFCLGFWWVCFAFSTALGGLDILTEVESCSVRLGAEV